MFAPSIFWHFSYYFHIFFNFFVYLVYRLASAAHLYQLNLYPDLGSYLCFCVKFVEFIEILMHFVCIFIFVAPYRRWIEKQPFKIICINSHQTTTQSKLDSNMKWSMNIIQANIGSKRVLYWSWQNFIEHTMCWKKMLIFF